MRHRFSPRGSRKVGLAPGTLVHLGERKTETARLELIDYGPEHLERREVESVEACEGYRERDSVTWINLEGLHDVALVEGIGRSFGLHPLVLEDLLNTDQRPKLEDYGDYLFLVLRMLRWDEAEGRILEEQVGLVLGRGFVLTFQERPGDIFDPLRERIRTASGRLRSRGADYLAYALVDSVVDHYFVILEKLGERIDELEEEVVTDPGRETVSAIHRLKRELLFLRRSVWPLREMLSALQREESPLVSEETKIFLRDVYDHTIQVIDTAETFREVAAGMLDTYLSSISHRLNEIMKVLTLVATIFIPLTFVAGIYGMNFEWMPELEWRWAYPAVLLLMVAVALGMLAYFRRRGWI